MSVFDIYFVYNPNRIEGNQVMSNKATRLITLIMLLQRKPNQKAAALAGELGISVRSLHRYFNMLEEIGIPVYAERGPYGGFSLVRGFRMPPIIFTPEEAVAIYLGTHIVESIWGDLYQEGTRGALAKLENVLPAEQLNEIRWAQQRLITTGINQVTREAVSGLLILLRKAIREQRAITCQYRTGGKPSDLQRTIHPYALLHRWGWWYVVAYCTTRRANRAFRLDRMEEPLLTDFVFSIPPDFDIHQYLLTEFEQQSLIPIRLRFSAEMEGVVRDSHTWWKTIENQKDGSILVSLEMPELTYPAKIVLSYGPGVEVLEPQELRKMVSEMAGQIFKTYI
jgi:predicted DNA-binding transcriptional regulator YafY